MPAARFNDVSATQSYNRSGYRLPDYGKIGVRPAAPVQSVSFSDFMLKGSVTDVASNCVVLEDEGGLTWRLAADQDAADLLGKTVTVWGNSRSSAQCGGALKISHAVYAEPWPKR